MRYTLKLGSVGVCEVMLTELGGPKLGDEAIVVFWTVRLGSERLPSRLCGGVSTGCFLGSRPLERVPAADSLDALALLGVLCRFAVELADAGDFIPIISEEDGIQLANRRKCKSINQGGTYKELIPCFREPLLRLTPSLLLLFLLPPVKKDLRP